MRPIKINWKILLVVLWVLLTCSMAIWWALFSLDLIDQLSALAPSGMEKLDRHRTMLKWEGATWVLLLTSGGLTLVYFVIRDHRRLQEFRGFVAAFSHDLKTSLASLRIQGQSLIEDMNEPDNLPLLERLVADTVRLEVQLENSLYMANPNEYQVYIEDVDLERAVTSLAPHWPKMNIVVKNPCTIRGDRRAIESVFKNIIHNSWVHGQAQTVTIEAQSIEPGRVKLVYSDDGKGFTGDQQQLGRIFYRHNPSSGSGLGFFIVKKLVHQMNGVLDFSSSSKKGFCLKLDIEGQLR